MIYLDHNATTPLCQPAWEAMQPYLRLHYGNPSSVHRAGREARAAIDNARDELAALLRVRPNELIFTGGGTEANNLALLGLARKLAPNGKHLISNRAEHHAVFRALDHLQDREDFEVTWLNVSHDGLIDPDELTAAIRPDTILVSIMTANNETGVIQPMEEIAARCRERGVLLHSDMVQAFAKSLGKTHAVIPSEAEGAVEGSRGAAVKSESQNITSFLEIRQDPSAPLRSARDDGTWGSWFGDLRPDAASFAAHKFYGPKGAGLLYLRGGLPIDSIHFGGAHENERRPGTENVAAIAGMAAAAKFILENQPNESALRDQLWRGLVEAFPAARQNGLTAPRLTNTLNVSFPGYSSETLLIALDLEGVCASSGSACMVGSVVASHVLLAMGLPMEEAGSAIRFSLGKDTTAAEIDQTIAILGRIFARRAAHPPHALV
ncbi:MAG: cysteine desulfurase [Chthoniobacterales bacterium]|nr:cysteine desulfurase [Chthoniobacterales bacterium]